MARLYGTVGTSQHRSLVVCYFSDLMYEGMLLPTIVGRVIPVNASSRQRLLTASFLSLRSMEKKVTNCYFVCYFLGNLHAVHSSLHLRQRRDHHCGVVRCQTQSALLHAPTMSRISISRDHAQAEIHRSHHLRGSMRLRVDMILFSILILETLIRALLVQETTCPHK